MEEHKQANEIWAGLSSEFARTADTFQNSVVAVHAGGRASSSAIVWRPDILVTTRHTLRRREGIEVIHPSYQGPAELAGVDAGTDLAVLRLSQSSLQPVSTSSAARMGEVVLAIGRSRLGDLSSSAGVIARRGCRMAHLARRNDRPADSAGCAHLCWAGRRRAGRQKRARAGNEYDRTGPQRSNHRARGDH